MIVMIMIGIKHTGRGQGDHDSADEASCQRDE